MMTGMYSILHMLADGACAFAMFGKFTQTEQGYGNILIYNFCAFALQMPFGMLLDLLSVRRKNYGWCSAFLGIFFTIIGAVTNPVILGIGNALFHVGGGVEVIHEDNRRKWKGAALGIFVAPGAFGLYVGTQLAGCMKESLYHMTVLLLAVMMVSFGVLLEKERRKRSGVIEKTTYTEGKFSQKTIVMMIGCFLVVILRSYIGMAVSFSWKTTAFLGLLSVMAVVFGKMAGGILAAKMEVKKVIMLSLVLATIGYWFGQNVFSGIGALFFFNMTMPITLYLLVCELKGLPGFSFGVLTFGLFLGFLPVYFEVKLPIADHVLGMAGSIVSLLILMIAVKMKGDDIHGNVSD